MPSAKIKLSQHHLSMVQFPCLIIILQTSAAVDLLAQIQNLFKKPMTKYKHHFILNSCTSWTSNFDSRY